MKDMNYTKLFYKASLKIVFLHFLLDFRNIKDYIVPKLTKLLNLLTLLFAFEYLSNPQLLKFKVVRVSAPFVS